MKNVLKKTKKGFTIVELVIVIAVIGILSAILIPTFVNLTDKANKAALQSNLTNAYTEYYAEALDNYKTMVSVTRDKAFLSVESDAANADSKYYKFADNEWTLVETEYSVSGYTFSSVYTSGTVKAFNNSTYYVYYAKANA